MNNIDIFIVGVGRLVQGHPLEFSDKAMVGGPLMTQAGEPRKDYWFRLAYPKSEPGIQELFAAMTQVAQSGFPGGQHVHSNFSWKFIDGDAPEYVDKKEYNGCWIIKFSSGYPPKCYSSVSGEPQLITDKNQIKTGYYARVGVSIKPNGQLAKPGIYLNPYIFELVAYGEEIYSGPDGLAILREIPNATLPSGASTVPLINTQIPGQVPGQIPGQVPGQIPAQVPGQMPGQAPQHMPGQVPGQMPGQAPQHMPGQAPQHMPGQAPQHMPGQAPQQMPGQAPQQILGQAPQQMLGQAPQQMPGQVPQQIPAQVPGQMPGQAPQQMPGQAPQQMPTPGQAPQHMPGQAPQHMPGQAPQQMPGQAPQQMPGQAPQQMPGQAPQPDYTYLNPDQVPF
jgi:hypothetical protein